MNAVDILLMIMILSGAGYLAFRSLFKKKGCASCSVSGCAVKNLTSKKVLIK